MSNKDDEILDILSESFKKEAENTELPEALSKDNIVAMLKAQQAKEQSDAEAEEKRNNIKVSVNPSETDSKKKSPKKFTSFLAAAAAFAVIVGAGSYVLKNQNNAVKSSGETQTSETAANEAGEEVTTEEYATTAVEQVTEVIVDDKGNAIGTEVATDDSGNILTTVISGVRDVVDNTLSQGLDETGTAAAFSTTAPDSDKGTTKPQSGININRANGGTTGSSIPGYSYSNDGYYYINDSSSQSVSYNDFLSRYSDMSDLSADQIRVCFDYEGKEWMILLRKGQYDSDLMGAEICSFSCDADKYDAGSTDYGNFTSDPLEMSLSMSYKKDGESGSYRTVFARPYSDTWHCTGFVDGKLQKYTAPRTELKTLNKITFKSADMANAFADRLEKLGFTAAESGTSLTDDTYAVNDKTVYILWNSVCIGDISGS